MKNIIEFPENMKFFYTKREINLTLNSLLFYLLKSKNAYLSLRIIDDKNIKEINKYTRSKDKPTDVLSFPAPYIPSPHRNLGDIIISHETLLRQAVEIGHTKEDEFLRLLVHGVLHLLGYDHEISREEEIKMQKKEDECLDILYKTKILKNGRS